MAWCLRLESPNYIYVTVESVLKRIRLSESLTVPQMKILNLASPEQPMQVELEIGSWRQGAFDGTLSEIHIPPPRRFVRRSYRILKKRGRSEKEEEKAARPRTEVLCDPRADGDA